jgi:nitrite reductase (NADH) large subunit
MSDILIIGNSAAAIAAVEQVRRENSSAEITLFCPEVVLPYDRPSLAGLIAKDIKEQQIFLKTDKFFAEHKVKLIHNEALSRVSLKRKQITTESKTHIPFGKLLLVDLAAVQLPTIKGNHKTGVFNPFLFQSIKELSKYLPFMDTVIVPVTNFGGFDLACALSRLQKDVVILAPGGGVLNEVFDEETSLLLKQIVEAKGIRVVTDKLQEVLGDTEVKAVRLASGKVIGAQAVILDQVSPDFRALADTGLVVDGALQVGEFFNTQAENVFACGSILGAYDLTVEEAQAQGRCAASNLLSPGHTAYQAPLPTRLFGRKICDGFCGGNVQLQNSGREHMKFDGPSNVYKKVFLVNDALQGAVCFNALQDKEVVRQALIEKKSFTNIETEFL